MGTYNWTSLANTSPDWIFFDDSFNPPIQVISLPVPVATELTLIRTIIDVQYGLLVVSTNTASAEPYGGWDYAQVDASVWTDPSGIVTETHVPKPFLPSPHIPPEPVWEAMLYSQFFTYANSHEHGWSASYRPLAQGASKAERKQLPEAAMTSWLSVRPHSATHWDAENVIQYYSIKYAVKQLWLIEVP